MSQVNQQLQPNIKKYSKIQSNLIFKSCLIGGVSFALIMAIAWGFFTLFQKNNFGMQIDSISIIGTVLLFVAIGFGIFLSFKGLRASWGLIASTYILYIFSFGLSFSFYFLIFDMQEMFLIFALTAASMLITGGLGFIISHKMAFTLMRVVTMMFIAYFIFTLMSMLLMRFIFQTQDWYYYLIVCLLAIMIFGSNIYTFYTLKNSSTFIGESDLDKSVIKKYTWIMGFQILVSIINTFILMVRLFAMVSR